MTAQRAGPAGERSVDNLRGAVWLLADMALNIWSLAIVKALGLGYPPSQLVFLRAVVGFVLIAPWLWHRRAVFNGLAEPGLHLFRVGLSFVTLTASFYAVARLPFALFTAVNFARPVVVMVLAVLVLGEVVGARRWIAAGVAFLGVLIAVSPGQMSMGSGPALLALGLAVVTGSAAIIVTRRLRAAPTVVLMAFYTGGLACLTAPIAAWVWVPVTSGHLAPLLAVGMFAQLAQLCFLRAHFLGEATFLSVLGYLSLIGSAIVGYVVFHEVPTLAFAIGATLVIVAAATVTLTARRQRR